jgi:hypothetical protein
MVSGFVGSRLRIADYAFGTNPGTLTPQTNNENKIHLVIEHPAYPPITPEFSIVPGGRQTVDFWINQPFMEIKCTGGRAGSVRVQINSRLKWEEMAYDKVDPFFAPQLWNQKFVTAGVIAPSPFPTP